VNGNTDVSGMLLMLSTKKCVHYQEMDFEYDKVEYEKDTNILVFTKGDFEELTIPVTKGVNFYAD
jgi:hypothetical protein